MAKNRWNEQRKLRDVDRCRREKEVNGKNEKGFGRGREGWKPGRAQPGLFTARANEPNEAQILIFSMYMDEY